MGIMYNAWSDLMKHETNNHSKVLREVKAQVHASSKLWICFTSKGPCEYLGFLQYLGLFL